MRHGKVTSTMRVGKHKVQKGTGSMLLELVLRSEVEKVTFEMY